MRTLKLTLSAAAILTILALAATAQNRPGAGEELIYGETMEVAPSAMEMDQMSGGNYGMEGYGMGGTVAMSGRSVSRQSRKVLVIPTSEIEPEKMAATIEDMQVMSHIVERTIQSSAIPDAATSTMFKDLGAFFVSGDVGAQAVYIEGYGALFLMTVDFPLSVPDQAATAKTTDANEPVDKTWQQARQQVLSPGSVRRGRGPDASRHYGADRIENLKAELIKALKHASNMQNIAADESVIVTLSSKSVSRAYHSVRHCSPTDSSRNPHPHRSRTRRCRRRRPSRESNRSDNCRRSPDRCRVRPHHRRAERTHSSSLRSLRPGKDRLRFRRHRRCSVPHRCRTDRHRTPRPDCNPYRPSSMYASRGMM